METFILFSLPVVMKNTQEVLYTVYESGGNIKIKCKAQP